MLDLLGSKRYGSVMERIERDTFYEPNCGCWLYAGPTDEGGYGRVRVGRKKVRISKFTYERDYGPLPKGKLVMHSCDIPCCWNPDHLSDGTHKDNRRDAMVKGRLPRGETATGAKLTNEDVVAIRASNETHRSLGDRYGVAHSTIGNIKRRKKWRHLP
jgi:hypothetical protein